MHIGLRTKLLLVFMVLTMLVFGTLAQAYITTRTAAETAVDVAAVVDAIDYIYEPDHAVNIDPEAPRLVRRTAPNAEFFESELQILQARLAEQASRQHQTMALLIAVAMTTLVVTSLFFNKLFVPLNKLYQELEIHAGDQIEQVAQGFNKMIARVRDDEFLAASLQERLLPDMAPNIPGLNVYARQRQARVVGGDWYDYHAMDGTLAFTIADSSGKGMSGALLSTVAMTALRSQTKTRANICKVLEQVNLAIESRLGGDNFVTMITGFADPVTGTVTVINCGHEPPLIYRAADDEWTMANHPSTMPLGINAHHFRPRPAVINVEPGDKLFFYTDGLHDVRDQNRRFLSMEQIISWLEAVEQQPIQSGIETLLAKTIAFANGDIQDDITILIIEFEPVNSLLEQERSSM